MTLQNNFTLPLLGVLDTPQFCKNNQTHSKNNNNKHNHIYIYIQWQNVSKCSKWKNWGKKWMQTDQRLSRIDISTGWSRTTREISWAMTPREFQCVVKIPKSSTLKLPRTQCNAAHHWRGLSFSSIRSRVACVVDFQILAFGSNKFSSGSWNGG